MEPEAMAHGIGKMEKFALWDLDITAIFIILVFMGLALNYLIICTAIAITICTGFSRLKYGKPEGYTVHLLYKKGLLTIKGMPASWQEEFLE